ncbi:hypothetical protein TruAng_006694 [Truncatella angustata]|nr:hypothetical protein TruAng_006694 [Truncatella angustata]
MNAWECRDQAEQAEAYYNHPLRVRNQQLEDENLLLKRMLRENGCSWPSPYATLQQRASSRNTRSSISTTLPHLPTEIVLKVLSFAMTSSFPIIDPLCKTRREHGTEIELRRKNQIAIHFLAASKACNTEGKKFLWANNRFTFTTVQAVKTFAEIDLALREQIHEANFRIIARFYDDENRVHKLSRDYHSTTSKRSIRLRVNKRAKEPTLARRGFRSYAWLQLVDFLEALLPPHDPNHDNALPRKRLLPNLRKLRLDLVNFAEDMWQFPTAQLHDVAAHHLGCCLDQVIVTGLPRDDVGIRAVNDLQGLLKDDGLFIDHDAAFLAQARGSLKTLPGNHMHLRVVRAMRPAIGVKHHHHDDHPTFFDDFPPAPADPGEPPVSEYQSCRTMWKKVPKHIDHPEQTKWVMFDRVSGFPWDDVEDEILMEDEYHEFEMDDFSDFGDVMVCENCGDIHAGPIRAEMMDDLYDDF